MMVGPAFDAIAAVLWDMDGTLADSEPLHSRTLRAVLASQGVVADLDLADATAGLAEGDVYALCAARFSLDIPRADWTAFRNDAYAREAALLEARPGAIEAFLGLRARGVRQAIVSNSSRHILDIGLGALGLAELEAVTVSRTDVRCGKPDPEPYLHAAGLLGVSPRAALVVEDSAVGASAGLAAGMRVLVWPACDVPAQSFPAGCLFVSSAAELAAFLSFHVCGVS